MACSEISEIIDKFNTLTQKPVKFLTIQVDLKEDIKNLVKTLYDYSKSQEYVGTKENKSALPELIVKDFDEEQIWQEIELKNTECWDQLVWEVANYISSKDALKFPIETDIPVEKEAEDMLSSNDNDQSDNEINKEVDITKKLSKKPKEKVRSSVVDDKFFKLQDMEKFLLKEEKNEEKGHKRSKKEESDSDEESIDMFEELDSEGSGEEEGGKEMMYNDFFNNEEGDYNAELGIHEEHTNINDEDGEMEKDKSDNDSDVNKAEELPKNTQKKVKFAGLSSEDDSSEDSKEDDMQTNLKFNNRKEDKKSDFELRQQRLQQQISRLEEKTLKESPWQLKGEIDALKRPQNSLLEEVVDFDLTSRPAPIITEETTLTLEDIIKRRVKDKAWDDVVKKDKPVDDQLSFRKTEVLDHAKSKLSLAQVYEAEYLKQKAALSGEKEEEKEPESHTEIRDAMSKLFAKLDALCHYHYTPKAPQADVKIVSNTPAISMEEVAPVATSDATLLAPEEVKKKRRGDLMSQQERTQADKNRERRKKKKLQRKKGQLVKVTDNRNTKTSVEATDKSLKTSKAFFQQLNDDATSIIKSSKNKRYVKNKGQ